ncbi:5'-methylthioadenosine/adenosylhomocysteine nucleosidase [Pusillimonas sp. TS35]|uniref:5'-methylthioadenosine/adenosylhomocysteine nucleosidase n=1 Tax=Paracandidimonas lactea TaxID=2895524 RepID=UPI00136A0D1F|nr:5'-methylthioadenosine/adenosylhomocysteine nucleosidase [Paracandidimonas lactea]MYN13276.1 5'-methylthioadenosine/adenosylhomocysteine nucleosidase [Pusillimonas sp. TS35]
MMKPLGIIAAMHGELAELLAVMGPDSRMLTIGGRDYYLGRLDGHDCVAVLARVGKVAAAATTVTMIRELGVGALVFTGLAGAVASHLNVGDVVVADSLLQHDMDARPLFPRFEIPLLGCSRFNADAGMSALLAASAQTYLDDDFMVHAGPRVCTQFRLRRPRVHRGMIVSGDRFVSDSGEVATLRAMLPDALCVEMEGAAVAQICHEYDMPFAVIRTISDRADDEAGLDFNAFLEQVASVYSVGIMRRFLAVRARA